MGSAAQLYTFSASKELVTNLQVGAEATVSCESEIKTNVEKLLH